MLASLILLCPKLLANVGQCVILLCPKLFANVGQSDPIVS